MKTAQIIILILQLLCLLLSLNHDVNGRKGHGPLGFGGVVITLVVYALYGFVLYKAGAYSSL